jgi:hypothetical protein
MLSEPMPSPRSLGSPRGNQLSPLRTATPLSPLNPLRASQGQPTPVADLEVRVASAAAAAAAKAVREAQLSENTQPAPGQQALAQQAPAAALWHDGAANAWAHARGGQEAQPTDERLPQQNWEMTSLRVFLSSPIVIRAHSECTFGDLVIRNQMHRGHALSSLTNLHATQDHAHTRHTRNTTRASTHRHPRHWTRRPPHICMTADADGSCRTSLPRARITPPDGSPRSPQAQPGSHRHPCTSSLCKRGRGRGRGTAPVPPRSPGC